MRILQITPEFPPNCGGIGYYVYYLSRQLLEMGHDASVILRSKKDRDYTYNGVRVKEVRVSGIPPFNLRTFGKNLKQILNNGSADLVHSHSTSMPPLNINCPVVVTGHWCMKEGVPVFYRPIKDLDALYRNLFLPFYVRTTKKVIKSCNKLTVVSNSLRLEFEKHYNTKADVIFNGVDTDLFKSTHTEKENAILFVGAFRMGKGVLDLLNIAGLLKKSHPGTKIYMIGGGPLKRYVQKKLRKRGLFNVQLVDSVTHDRLVYYYNISRIFVLPTYYEGLPNTILEAMACKLPVVATNVSGIPDQISEGVTGYMLSPGDVKGFYHRIVELLEDPEKQRIFGEKAREKILEKFTWPHIAKGIIGHYEELLCHVKKI